LIKTSEYFFYAGIDSRTYDINNVNINTGLQNEPYISSIDLRETEVFSRERPYFQGIKRKPLQFELTFYYEDHVDENFFGSVKRWLSQSYYTPLTFSENPARTYYAIMVGEPTISHTGLMDGYISATFRCDSPYAYSSLIASPVYSTVNELAFSINNTGDVPCSPTFIVNISSGGTLVIRNNTTGKFMSFSGLANNEQLTIDCDRQEIQTDIPDIYRYDNLIDGDFFDLVVGENSITISGNIIVQAKYELKYL
jgi:phage-related protein